MKGRRVPDAWHEAGHATMSLALGVRVALVRLSPCGGETHTEWLKGDVLVRGLVSVAGSVAHELRYLRREPRRALASDLSYLRRVGFRTPRSLSLLREMADGILRPEWLTVTAIAAALVAKDLNGRDVRVIWERCHR